MTRKPLNGFKGAFERAAARRGQKLPEGTRKKGDNGLTGMKRAFAM